MKFSMFFPISHPLIHLASLEHIVSQQLNPSFVFSMANSSKDMVIADWWGALS